MEFITAEERDRLNQQLEELKAKRPILAKRIGEARELGDLRENADYHAAREEQGINEARIRQLEERLAGANVAGADHALPADMVFVGAVVRLRNVESDDLALYKLVGEASGSFSDDYIEVTTSSPMGKALMRARVGEVVRVDLPRGTKRFEIREIVS